MIDVPSTSHAPAAISFTVGMGQQCVVSGDVEGNLRRAVVMIERAGRASCAVVVLPECLNFGWTDESALTLAPPIPGAHSEELCRAARESNIFVVAGLVERAGDRLYNAAILIAPDGNILLKHRKINELDIAQHIYSTGDSLSVAHTPLGTFGVNICADNFPDALVIGHTLARMGAQILLSPCAWAMPPDHDNAREPYGALWEGAYSTLARLYDITVVGVSGVGWLRGGAWDGYKCIGCSLAIGPGGRVIAQAPYGENAEGLFAVPVEILPRSVTGTRISEMLASKE